MDQKELKQFLVSLKDTDIEELRLEAGDTKVFFRRSEVPVNPALTAAAAAAAAAAAKPVAEEKKIFPVKSPMVGTFFHSEASDRPPFVLEGNHIKPGQKIGIIEAMKIMKDVNSDLGGRITQVLVKNGQPVEYGQKLFLVDTSDVK